MNKTNSPLNPFHPLIKQWFQEQIGTPTDIQAKSWPAIANQKHTLITAPTGSGKTLTAFLWAINNFITNKTPPEQQRVLYISPLKALNNDIQRNLQTPLTQLREYFQEAKEPFPEIRTAVRSGDTDPTERRQMSRYPPEILITTPESLNVLLASKSGRRMLTGFSAVILDEIHAVADTKRGTYLITAIERLTQISGEFQRIALSATVKPLEKIAQFVGGFQLSYSNKNYHYQKRTLQIIQSNIQKKYQITVDFPGTKTPKKHDKNWWHILTDTYNEIIKENRSTLLFANSRRMVEKMTRFINETDMAGHVYSHHGSLSKEIRSVVEKRFKNGELSAIIATSSLELGIDIGSVDEVVLIQTPFSIASTIQRIGRAGHGVGQVSKGAFVPIHTRNLIESAVIAANIRGDAIESITPLESPLDVLAQIVLSMTLLEPMDIDDLFHQIRASYPYRHLERKEFDLVLDMLSGRYAAARIKELKPRLLVDKIKNTAKAREHTAMLLYLSGGVIPDRGYFNMRDAETKAKIGELDEEFVWERSLGDAFPFGNQVWRIQRITHNDVEVVQVPRSNSLVPFWRADEMNRSYHLSEKIGLFLEEAEQELKNEEYKHKLTRDHHMTPRAAEALIDYLRNQKNETNAPLPHRNHILVEHFNDPANVSDTKQTVLHTLWGGHVNRPLALALAAAWEKKFKYSMDVFVNNDCIMLNLPHSFTFDDILELVKPDQVRALLRTRLESTGYFGARFRENAQRALLLPRQGFNKRMPLWLNRLRSKKLLEATSHFDDFPVLLETWRQCLGYDFEIDTLLHLLEEVATGQIAVTETVTKKPSPFTDGIIWKQTNQYMYDDDSPVSKLRSNLSDALLKDVMYASHLRPRFPEELLETFQQKLHRVAPGYAPDSADELLLWVKERLFIPAMEWDELVEAMDRDLGDRETGAEELVAELEDRLFRLERGGLCLGVLALENLPRVGHGLGLEEPRAREVGKQLGMEAVFENDPEETFVSLFAEWLRYYGPVSHDFIREALPVAEEWLVSALETLREDGKIIIDRFREEDVLGARPETGDDDEEGEEGKGGKEGEGGEGGEGGESEICHYENLEILLRMRRALARPTIEPREIEELPLFLAHYQGLTRPGEGIEDLQGVMERLFGYPSRAGLWETDIFPARMQPYYGNMLDTVMREHGVIWFGSGNERLSFCFDADIDLFVGGDTPSNPKEKGKEKDKGKGEKVPGGVVRKLEELFRETPGKFDLGHLSQVSGVGAGELTGGLWHLAWGGRVTNDGFKVVRHGVMNKFKPEKPLQVRTHSARQRRRLGFGKWQNSRAFSGNWFALPWGDGSDDDVEVLDALDRLELVKDRVRLLFARYGVLFREVLWNELPGMRWSRIFKVLRLMELSGEIVSGYFFKGVSGLQFCTPSVLGVLMGELPGDVVYWVNAADPASLCGVPLEGLKPLLPQRQVTTHVVFCGREVVLVSKRGGRELIINVEADHPRLGEYLGVFRVMVEREFLGVKYVEVESVNGEGVLGSKYVEVLRGFGFRRDYKTMVLEKKY